MRLLVAALMALAAGCAQRGGAMPELPARVAGAERTAAAMSAEMAAVLAEMKAAGQTGAVYVVGGKRVEVAAVRLGSAASAFEARQRWRAREGMVGINVGTYFVVAAADPAQVPAAELIRFAQEFEKSWAEAAGR